MLIRPFLTLFRQKQLGAMVASNALYKPFYTLSYLAALKTSGLMDMLKDQTYPFEYLIKIYTNSDGAKSKEALLAWLQMGCRLRLLRRNGDGYTLRGLAKKMAQPENDAALALSQEVASLHYKLIMETPAKLRAGELWTLGNQDGELTTRSSRALEAFQLEALRCYFPKSGPCRLLEIGCGSGIYIKHAMLLNPQLTALGIELQQDAANVALRNILDWGLQDRAKIEIADIRTMQIDPTFDVATLHNNIYYFRLDERVAILSKIRTFLKPSGSLLLTTCCQGGNPGIEALNLWGASNAEGDRLPSVGEMVKQLSEAGFMHVNTMRLIPGDSFYAFCAK